MTCFACSLCCGDLIQAYSLFLLRSGGANPECHFRNCVLRCLLLLTDRTARDSLGDIRLLLSKAHSIRKPSRTFAENRYYATQAVSNGGSDGRAFRRVQFQLAGRKVADPVIDRSTLSRAQQFTSCREVQRHENAHVNGGDIQERKQVWFPTHQYHFTHIFLSSEVVGPDNSTSLVRRLPQHFSRESRHVSAGKARLGQPCCWRDRGFVFAVETLADGLELATSLEALMGWGGDAALPERSRFAPALKRRGAETMFSK